MKALSRIFAIVMLISLLVACAPAAAPATEAPSQETEAAPATEAAPLTPQEEWLKANGLGSYDTGEQDWAAIEAAALKEGKVIVYANSSKIEKAAEKFMELYPGIVVEGYDLGGGDVYLKTVEEQKAGAFTGDVWFSSGGPDIKGELIPKGYLWRFVPSDLVDVVPAELTDPLLTSRFGVRVFAYNKELNPDGCPIKNIWELTNPEWKGKVFIEDPLNDASTLGILMSIATHEEELIAAYKELYGTDPVLDADTETVGQLWFKRFAQNGPVAQPGGDEVDSAFALPGMTESYIGFTSYSNYPDVLEGNLVFEPCWDLMPIVGVKTQNYLGILNQSPHPNAAKMFIRFILTPEGSDPWLKIGNYNPRSDVPVPDGAMALEDLNKITWTFDDGFVYDNIIQWRDFYLLNLPK